LPAEETAANNGFPGVASPAFARAEEGAVAQDCPPAEPVIDWSVARKAVRGDDRLLQTIVKTAMGEIPSLLSEIRRAVAAGDFQALRLAAHTLKGSIRYFGAQSVLEPALRLEAMGQGRQLEGAGEVLSILDQSAERLMAALAERLLSVEKGTVMDANEVIP